MLEGGGTKDVLIVGGEDHKTGQADAAERYAVSVECRTCSHEGCGSLRSKVRSAVPERGRARTHPRTQRDA
jgi:hypothetical protein